MTKNLLRLSCATSALALILGAGAARAATAVAAADATDTSQTSAASVAEIVVVAEGREQKLQGVPVAITAFTTKQRDIEGITSLEEMTAFAPGLTYSSQVDHLYVRGVGRQTTDLADPAGVATFFDGFYNPDPILAVLPPMFVQDTEVFRGPQGTLGGRNGIGGALLVTAKRPTDTPYGEARVSFGNYGYTDVEMAASGPIFGGVDGRIGGTFTTQPEGYFKDLAGGPSEGGVITQYHLEGAITAKLGDNFDLYVRAAANDWDNGAGGPGSRVNTQITPYSTFLNDDSDAYNFNPAAGYNPSIVLPGSLKQINPNITGNPSVSNIREFSGFGAITPSQINLSKAYDVNGILTYHAPGFDVRYTAGYAQYAYRTRDDFAQQETDVISYVIPQTQNLGFGANPTCAPSLNPFTSCLTVYPNIKLDYTQTDAWYSHELTFLSTDNGPLQWVAGLYYYHEAFTNPINLINAGQAQVAAPCGILGLPGVTPGGAACPASFGLGQAPADPSRDLAFINYNMSESSYAGYGQVDWKINSQFKLTGGLRYTYDSEGGEEYLRAVAFGGSGEVALLGAAAPALLALTNPNLLGAATPALDETAAICYLADNLATHVPGRTSACSVNPTTGIAQRSLSGSSSGVTGTAGVEWTPDNSTLAYVRYSRGYKSLGFNAGFDMVAIPQSEVAPEFMNDYELGLKKSFGRTLTIDATLFYEDYINAQVPLVVLTFTGPQTVLTNIPSTASEGFELEANWSPVEHLNLSLSYAFDNTKVLTSCNAATGVGCYGDAANPNGNATGPAGLESIKGNELPNAPKNKLSLNGYYTWEFDPGDLTLSVSYLWRDRQFGSIFDAPWWIAPSSSDVDLRATWAGKNDRYEVVGYIKNVFNSLQYESGAAATTAGNALTPTVYTQGIDQYIDPPRTFGIEFHYKFF